MQSFKRKPRDQKPRSRFIGLALITVLALGAALAFQGLTAPASPGASAIQGPATVVFEKGEVALGEAASDGEVAWKPAASGMAVLPGMRIRTFEGYADLLLPGRSMVRIAPHTELILIRMEIFEAGQAPAQATGQAASQAKSGQAVTRLFLSIGRIWVHVIRQIDYLVDFEVQTPSAVAGVRGTIFSVMVAADGSTVVSVYKGKVSVSAGEESKMADRRQEIRSKTGGPMQHLRKFSGEETRAWKEQEGWLKDQEELDKQVEKEKRLHEKGGAGGRNTDKDDGDKESGGGKSDQKEEPDGGDGHGGKAGSSSAGSSSAGKDWRGAFFPNNTMKRDGGVGE